MTMARAGEQLSERCQRAGIHITVAYLDLWVSDFLPPGTDVVIEMFPYFKNLSIPVISGRPFLSGMGEKELFESIISTLLEIRSHDSN